MKDEDKDLVGKDKEDFRVDLNLDNLPHDTEAFPSNHANDLVNQEVTYVDSTEDGEALSTRDILKKQSDDLKKCRKEKEEYLTGWQRAKADYVNLQRELDASRINISIHTKERMVQNLMPALDSFDMAFVNKEAWEKVDPNWRQGVEYIYSQLMTGLIDSGIEKIDQIGVKFDPNLHQSIASITTDKEDLDHSIESIAQVGYKIGDSSVQAGRVIRPARVNIYEYKIELGKA